MEEKVIIDCPKCSQRLYVPFRMAFRVTCPTCREVWEWQPSLEVGNEERLSAADTDFHDRIQRILSRLRAPQPLHPAVIQYGNPQPFGDPPSTTPISFEQQRDLYWSHRVYSICVMSDEMPAIVDSASSREEANAKALLYSTAWVYPSPDEERALQELYDSGYDGHRW